MALDIDIWRIFISSCQITCCVIGPSYKVCISSLDGINLFYDKERQIERFKVVPGKCVSLDLPLKLRLWIILKSSLAESVISLRKKLDVIFSDKYWSDYWIRNIWVISFICIVVLLYLITILGFKPRHVDLYLDVLVATWPRGDNPVKWLVMGWLETMVVGILSTVLVTRVFCEILHKAIPTAGLILSS